MSSEFRRILGAIAPFCHSVNVGQIHLLQCDTNVTKDEMLTPEQLNNYTIAGLGGSDLSAAMYLLAQDWELESAIVITYGYISYPRQSMPYQVLWVLTEDYSGFSPSYGTIITLA